MANLTLIPISKDTGIGSEFIGIYNGNNNNISSKISEIENRISEIDIKNNSTFSNLQSVINSNNILNVENGLETLIQNYNDLSAELENYREKYDALLEKYKETLGELKKIEEALQKLL